MNINLILDKASETKEKMRKKTVDSLEFGPNASWIPFPRTKLIYTAAKTNNLEMAKEAIVQGNIDAYGTCKHWTPLHWLVSTDQKVIDMLKRNNYYYCDILYI